jgi:hypothetical protein
MATQTIPNWNNSLTMLIDTLVTVKLNYIRYNTMVTMVGESVRISSRALVAPVANHLEIRVLWGFRGRATMCHLRRLLPTQVAIHILTLILHRLVILYAVLPPELREARDVFTCNQPHKENSHNQLSERSVDWYYKNTDINVLNATSCFAYATFCISEEFKNLFRVRSY